MQTVYIGVSLEFQMCGMNFFMLTLLIFDRSYVNVSSMYEALSFGSCSQEFEMQNLALNLSLHW
jgi:hypothetical protein